MKTTLAILLACILCSCHQIKTVQKNGGIILDIEIGDSQSKQSDIAKTIEILKHRVEMICTTDPIVTVNSRTLHIEMPTNTDALVCNTLLIQRGEFEIMESYEANDVLPFLSEVNKALVENKNFDFIFPIDSTLIENNPLFNLISIQQTALNGQLQSGPAVGYVMPKDTALINSIFLHPELSKLLPRDLVFKWAKERNSTEQELFILIATKKNYHEKLITSDMIMDATTNEQNGMNVIQFTFNQETHQRWERITQENIGKALPMIIDDFVVSYPMVQSEIEGGKSSISGNYNIEEARAIAAILKYGILPLPVKIQNLKVVTAP